VALQGTIDTFELTEVVRLLAAGGKSGVLRLEGSRGSGRLWIDGGKVTGIEVDHAPRTEGLAEAMFELLRFVDGSFTFDSGEAPEDEGEPTDVEDILVDAEAKLAEWREIEQVVPTTRATVTLRPELERADVVLDKARWRLVAAIAGGVTVATLGEAMELGELPVSKAVKELIDLGVVDLDATKVDEPVIEPAAVVAPEATYDELEIVPEPVAEPEIVPEPVDEPEIVDEPEPFALDEAMNDTAPLGVDPAPVDIGTDPVLSDPADDDGSARSTLDEFAAGFGLSDPPAFDSSSMMDAAPLDASPRTGDDGFGDFTMGDPSTTDAGTGASTDFDPLGDFSLGLEPEPSGFDDAGSSPAESPDMPTAPGAFLGASNDAAEVARQLSNLSPAAARAVAAAAKATTDEEREAALATVAQEGDQPIDRELLLRFLASVKA
jgi:hypothetical protein